MKSEKPLLVLVAEAVAETTEVVTRFDGELTVAVGDAVVEFANQVADERFARQQQRKPPTREELALTTPGMMATFVDNLLLRPAPTTRRATGSLGATGTRRRRPGPGHG